MMLRLLLHLAILIGTGAVILYVYFRRQYEHWKKKNVPFEAPSFFFGSIKQAATKNMGVLMRELYEKSKTERFYGLWFLHKPVLLINDLDLVKDILVKNFMSFHDHGVYHDEKVDPLSANLFSIEGAKWRNIRAKLTPTFTSGKMKMMFPTVKKCGDELKEVMEEIADKGEAVEMKDLIGRFTTDIIASCAFGIEANSLKNPDAIFRVMGRKLFEPSWNIQLRNIGSFIAPEIARLIKLRPVPKYIGNFFIDAMRETIKYREKNNVKRKDFLQLLIQLMEKGYVEDVDTPDKTESLNDKTKFTFEEAVPQAFIFFVGGFETSSTTMQFILYELALNEDVQDKLRQEIKETLADSNGEMNYENVHKMEYMGWVIEETLRKYPPGSFLSRVCTKEYKIPGTDLVLEKGSSICIPTYGFQMDERYFPNPDKFDPDRFSEEAKSARNHYSYLPFGDGPRICIGQRFAMMQMRVALVTVLSHFRVSIAEGKTPIPMDYDPKLLILGPKGGMHLKISRL